MKINTNLVHSVLNWAIAIIGALAYFLIQTGCFETVSGSMVCTESWLNPELAAALLTIIGVVKTLINILRDGLLGFLKEQPPVK